ncbi:dienelactone hydrolase family protein [Flavobacterium orientale]|uniref:Dienelactone hydrolase n=1 Tax=Flavobacterium orientale TaxID=1756020 RepID=A0A917DBW8_9FLAO|nr:dienelactone hydrolase family protein [Flavobacterium orientale]GGD24139.1 dienelactone hydrolase [Flavobacterium orientale]
MKKFLFCLLWIPLPIHAQLQSVSYNDGVQSLNGFVSKPATPNKEQSGILILPAWMGIDDHSKEVAQQLSALGHHAFIADIYGEGNYPTSTSEAGKQAGIYKKNVGDYQRRIQLALDELIKAGANKDKIIVIGYCFGGTGALEAARAGLNVVGVVSFHGGLGKAEDRTTKEVRPKVLVLHGADDPFVPEKEIAAFQKEMKDAKADWQMVYYSGAVHSFTNKKAGTDNSRGAAYNELADKRSFQHFLTFVKEIL